MKTLFKPLFAVIVAAVTFTSCMESDNTDYEAEARKEEQRVDSVLTAQRAAIQAYAAAEFESPREDTVVIPLPRIGKNPKRGIWYEIVSQPTDDSYEYKVNNAGTGLIYPIVKVKYKVSNLSGTVLKADETGSSYSMGSNANNTVVNPIWYYSFFPYSLRYNGQDIKVLGLTEKGLKKGSKIRLVTPSYWAFDNRTVGDIPGNQPLVYEFEVLEISNN